MLSASTLLAACVPDKATNVPNQDLAAPPAPFRAPYVPIDDSTVLQSVPAASDPQVRQMRQLQRALAAKPWGRDLAVRLSGAYIDFGRQIGDAHYAGYAQAVLAPWLASEPVPASVLVMNGVILQYQHQFDAARVQLQEALRRDPDNLQGWLTLNSIDMLHGDYTSANEDCVRVGLSEYGIACTAIVRASIGQAQQARQLLLIAQGQGASLPANLQAWLEGLLAETAGQLGDWASQEAHFRKALVYAPGDDFLLVNYADFLLDRGRPQEVLPLLANQSQSDTAFLRIALAQQALRSPQLGRYTWIMAARFEALTLRGSALYDREHSRFVLHLLHDPDTALKLAQGNWTVQRAAWDARVYLEAALAAHQSRAAAPVLAFLDNSHLQDPVIQSLVKQVRREMASQGSSGELKKSQNPPQKTKS